MLTTALIAVLLGLVAITVGLRGRRAGAEACCGGCGYDVTGLCDRPAAKCPECARGLSRPYGVVLGRRRRRPGLIAAGVAATLVSSGVAILASRDGNVIPHLPSRVLAGFTRWTHSGQALSELTARLDAGELSAASIAGVVEAGLELQANRTTAWDHRWGQFIETASVKGVLDPDEERRYLDHMFSVTRVRSRSTTLSGWSVPVDVQFDVRRGGVRGVNTRQRLVGELKGYAAAQPPLGGGFGLGPGGAWSAPERFEMSQQGGPRPAAPAAPVGDHVLDIDLTWWTSWGDAQPRAELTDAKLSEPAGTWRESRPIRVAEQVEQIVEAAPAKGDPLGINVSHFGVVTRREAGQPSTTKQTRDGSWERAAGAFPADVAVYLTLDDSGAEPGTVGAFDVYVVADGETQWLARTALEPGQAACVHGLVSVPPEAEAVDIVLRASPEAALTKALDAKSIVTDELVLPAVPVIREHPGLGGTWPEISAKPKGARNPLAPEPRRRRG